ncbi:MAG: hypothetical protein JSR48_07870 [Verrucomicrobia bacterium]|nr:hypothetical protein [Verrucomicrobiota bacterium]
MTPGNRSIRFARASTSQDSAPAESRLVATVLLDEQPIPVGQIIERGPSWEYVLAGSRPSGLASTVSRQDLERQVVLYHLGTLPGSKADAEPDSLPIAM